MDIKFANNASSKLVDNIEEETTVFNILPDTGVLFPILEQATDFFKITVVDPGTGDFEIMKVTNTEGDRFTVERGQENTLARAFPQNSIVENRLTAESIQVILNDVEASSTTAGRIRVATEEEVADGLANDAALTPANSAFLKVLRGTIVAYTGQVDSEGFVIDNSTHKSRDDWHACDGNYGTPDLRDRFILGAGPSYNYGSQGGGVFSCTVEVGGHKLTVEELPSHTHDTEIDQVGNKGYVGGGWGSIVYNDGNESNIWKHMKTKETGGNKSHTHPATVKSPNLMPPYYALLYIMKIK